MQTSKLAEIIRNKQQDVQELIALAHPEHPLKTVLNQRFARANLFSRALTAKGMSVIAEIKRQSPSVGSIAPIPDVTQLAQTYYQASAQAISVLTDSAFGGCLEDLMTVVNYVKAHNMPIPILRKDFIFHPLQLAETKLAGADAVLLIVDVVQKDLKTLLTIAYDLGLEVLTEVHNQHDLTIALEARAPIIGINHRNLHTFDIDRSIAQKLKPLIPEEVITVAESGIREAQEVRALHKLGFDAVLIGEALVRSSDSAAFIAECNMGG